VPPKLNRDVIARAALQLLDRAGIEGVTMRSLADDLGVRAPTLYWHVKSKRELLDAMADVIAEDGGSRVRPRSPEEPVEQWLGDLARSYRASMLRYRDGARVFVGSLTPNAPHTTELALRELRDAGYSLQTAAEAIVTLVSYTTGSVIEEQARIGLDYPENPYRHNTVDAERFPLSAQALPAMFNPNADAGFEAGLRMVLAGIRATRDS
jgi:TetR/AcrR family tetracycline transcriptional repressor